MESVRQEVINVLTLGMWTCFVASAFCAVMAVWQWMHEPTETKDNRR
jgi:hypothetical protein